MCVTTVNTVTFDTFKVTFSQTPHTTGQMGKWKDGPTDRQTNGQTNKGLDF